MSRTQALIGASATLSMLIGADMAAAQSSGSVTVTINLTVTATATVDTAKVQAATKTAIQGFMGERARFLTSTGPDTARTQSRLSGGSLTGGGGDPAAGFSEDDKPATNSRASRQHGMGFDAGAAIGSSAGSSGSAGFGNSGGNGSSGPGIIDSDTTPGTLSRFGRQAGRGTLPSGRDDSRDFAQQFGFGRDYTADQPASRAAMPFRFSGNAEDGTGRFAFATSLSQMRAAAEAKERERHAVKGASGVGALTEGDTPQSAMNALGLSSTTPLTRGAAKQAAVDVWVEGSSAYFSNDRIDGKRRGHASVVYAGTDVILMPGLLVGIMGQADWMADSGTGTNAAGTTVSTPRDGRGWMAGPYLAARLTPNLYFDTRAAWGRSTNHVDPLGAYVDTFTTSRALAAAKLTGDWSWGQLRVRPSAEVIWFRETSDAYTNAIGIAIDKQAFNLGRLTFGPEFGYRFALGDAGVFEPFVGLKGVWDFARTAETTAAGEVVGGDSIHGRIEAGATWRTPSGISVRASGQYDGVGASGFHAVQGKAQVVVPLQ